MFAVGLELDDGEIVPSAEAAVSSDPAEVGMTGLGDGPYFSPSVTAVGICGNCPNALVAASSLEGQSAAFDFF